MNDSTIGTIYAIKRHEHESYDADVATFWSKYSGGTPIEYYGEETLNRLAKIVFQDFIKTADNPSYEVWNLFECMRFDCSSLQKSNEEFDKRVRDAIWTALCMTQVRNDKGFVNGFRNIEKEL